MDKLEIHLPQDIKIYNHLLFIINKDLKFDNKVILQSLQQCLLGLVIQILKISNQSHLRMVILMKDNLMPMVTSMDMGDTFIIVKDCSIRVILKMGSLMDKVSYLRMCRNQVFLITQVQGII